MGQVTATRMIDAPIEKVFETVAHIGNYSRAVPHIVRVEFLSDTHSGVGTRFRETRKMGNKEVSTELEVTEFVENERIRIVSDTAGTIWDTVYTTRPVSEDAVELKMVMDDRAYRFLPKLVNPLIRGMIRKAVEKDLDAVKSYCEQAGA